MKQINYDYPIFVCSVGVAGYTKESGDKMMQKAMDFYSELNINMIYVSNAASAETSIKCIWEGPKHSINTIPSFNEIEF